MQRRVLRRFVTVLSAAAVAVGSLTSGAGSAFARPPVPVHATTIHPVTAPSFLQPGLVHLRNTGGDPLYLFRKKTRGVTSLVHDLNDHHFDGRIPRLFRHFGVVDVISGHSDLYARLRAGTYYLVDMFAERYKAADVHAIVVQGQVDNATPYAFRTVTVRKNGTLAAPSHGRRGHLFHFRNHSSRLQELELLPVRKSATAAQVAAVIAHPTPDKLFQIVRFSISLLELPTVTSGHEDLYIRFPKHAGRYIAMSVSLAGGLGLGVRRHHLALLTVH